MWETLKKKLWQWRGVLITVPSVTLIVIILRLTGLLQSWELTAFDRFILLRPQEPIDHRIIIVEIREEDIRQQKQWPISDRILARLLNNIKQQQPRGIGLDIYRDLPVPPGEQELAKVFKSTPNLIGIQKAFKSNDSSVIDPPRLLKERQQVGANDLPLDGDGKIRRGLLYLYLENDEIIESMDLKLALLYLKAEGITEQPATTNPNYLQLGRGVFPKFANNDGGYINAKAGSYQILLNYRGRIDRFAKVSLTDVLENKIPANLMRDKLVLIGSTGESLKDLLYTPYTSGVFSAPERMPGVVIHANLISQIISTALDNRPGIESWSEFWECLWIFSWSILGATWNWQQRQKNIPFITGVVIPGSILIAVSFAAFIVGWWIPVVPTLLALNGSAIAINQFVARSASQMKKTLGRYLTDEVVANLIESPSGLKLGGERRKVTILVSDIRGFSSISERLPPEQVVTLLNFYLEAMTDVINHHKGTINEFMGDGILVMFGAPISREDDSQRAIACAVAMQLAMQQVNQKNRQMNLPVLEMGIGINTGEVIAGNIGSQKRAQYTVIGSHVNLAARIESYTVGGQILISENSAQDANLDLRIDGKLEIEPKGIKSPITVFDIGGIGGEYQLFLPKYEDSMVTLNQELPVEYVILQGKQADGTILIGALVGLSENGGLLRTTEALELLSNLKVRLLLGELLLEEANIYAKVVKKSADDQHNFLIRFTTLPPKVIALFHSL
ncbi:adenylate/guanylate cyclase domain-containing protein [Cronbergia sp. UHCC 0137]|uniref:CHASE2 domain-containing protein n=1 Tax=Cronbergia sp. UHCC 0137 TaxID=3110239 RepID=UPI002B1F0DFF|nr:adenylate/guanylate cyclase domain-containing protein [Cronbergia sp. UHCC 0137]MEA5621209.1 adenylate/guanylate cyclase domain-containing protein [Cronbergia sp. UHCC 0137]